MRVRCCIALSHIELSSITTRLSTTSSRSSTLHHQPRSCSPHRSLENAASSSSAANPAAAFSQAHKSYSSRSTDARLRTRSTGAFAGTSGETEPSRSVSSSSVNRNVRNPRELAKLFEKAERELKRVQHPDPHRRKFLPLSCLAATGFGCCLSGVYCLSS